MRCEELRRKLPSFILKAMTRVHTVLSVLAMLFGTNLVSAAHSADAALVESLSGAQKAYLEQQRQLGFEYYRDMKFEQSLIEVRKIFEIVPDYKGAREIEGYALWGVKKVQEGWDPFKNAK
jgi:hypothetical protein